MSAIRPGHLGVITHLRVPAKRLTGNALQLLNAAHAHAMQYEPTSLFPGLDIDEIHRKARARRFAA
jgi:hypothetical protein